MGDLDRHQRALLWSVTSAVALTLLLPWLPLGGLLGWPLLLFDTFTHEMGHGLSALLVGGTFSGLELFSGGGGVAHTGSPAGVADAIVCAGGLLGPAVAAFGLFFFAARAGLSRIGLLLTGVVLGVLLVVFVDGTAGWLGLAPLALLFVVVAIKGRAFAQTLLLFLAAKLSMNVFSRGDYLFETDKVDPGNGQLLASDITRVATALGGHEYLWGALIGTVSVAILGTGVLWVLFANGVLRRGDRPLA